MAEEELEDQQLDSETTRQPRQTRTEGKLDTWSAFDEETLQKVLESIIDHAAQLLGARSAALYLLTEEGLPETQVGREDKLETISGLLRAFEQAQRRTGIVTISLHSGETLSLLHLIDDIVPYLQAIADLQRIIDEIKAQPHEQVVVHSITQGSALVSLEGAKDAIELILSVVVPWRYKHAREMAGLTEIEKRIQVEKAKAEVLASRRQLAQGTDREQAELELAKQRAEVAKIAIETEKLRLELHREKIQLALDVLDRINPDLTETEKIDYVVKLLKPLEVIALSELEPQLITDDGEATQP
jgi:hypothetical protein